MRHAVLLVLFAGVLAYVPGAEAQLVQGFGDSPFERKFGDVKFLDCVFRVS